MMMMEAVNQAEEELRGNPFLRFPEEVWKVILDQLKDSRDVLTMLKAYPELKVVMHGSRHLYLFDLVIPHVADWISEKALLKLRLVCQQWRNGVDHFLENQPSLRAYSHEEDEELGQNWNPKGYSRYATLYKSRTGEGAEDPSLPLFRRYYWLRYSFQTQLRMDKFLDDYGKFPPTRNPFMGRSVIINRHPWGELNYILSFWEKAHNLLATFGSHVWFIEIWEFVHQHPLHFAQTVWGILTLLPNLKSLHLEGGNLNWLSRDGGDDAWQKQPDDNITEFEFPTLPHLETLKLGDAHPDLADALTRRYSAQIKRLVWSTRAWNWKTEYGRMFTNLTELILVLPRKDMNRVNELLLTLDAPQLYRLVVGVKGIVEQPFQEEELVAWREHFPRLSFRHFRIVYGL